MQQPHLLFALFKKKKKGVIKAKCPAAQPAFPVGDSSQIIVRYIMKREL